MRLQLQVLQATGSQAGHLESPEGESPMSRALSVRFKGWGVGRGASASGHTSFVHGGLRVPGSATEHLESPEGESPMSRALNVRFKGWGEGGPGWTPTSS